MDWKDFFRKNINKLLIALIAGIAVFVGLYFQIFIGKSILSSIDSELNISKLLKNESNDNEKSELAEQNEAIRKANYEQKIQIIALKQRLAQSNSKENKILLSNQKVAEATVTYNNGDHNGAIKLCDEAITLNPNNFIAWYSRGTAYYSLKQYDRAIQDLNKAIQLNPNYIEAYNNRGSAYQLLGQYDRAISDFDKALEHNPNYTLAKNNRKLLREALGR